MPKYFGALIVKSFVPIIFACALIYGVGLLVYLYRKTTKDRFYELRDERRRKRTFSSAGSFVPKNRSHDSHFASETGSLSEPTSNQKED